MIHLLDHFLVAVIAVLFPLHSWREVRKAERQLTKPGAASFDTVRDYQRTIETCMEILNIESDIPEVNFLLGCCHMKLGAYAVNLQLLPPRNPVAVNIHCRSY